MVACIWAGSPVTAFFKHKHLRGMVSTLPNLKDKESEEAISKLKIDRHGLLSVQHMIPIAHARQKEVMKKESQCSPCQFS